MKLGFQEERRENSYEALLTEMMLEKLPKLIEKGNRFQKLSESQAGSICVKQQQQPTLRTS